MDTQTLEHEYYKERYMDDLKMPAEVFKRNYPEVYKYLKDEWKAGIKWPAKRTLRNGRTQKEVDASNYMIALCRATVEEV